MPGSIAGRPSPARAAPARRISERVKSRQQSAMGQEGWESGQVAISWRSALKRIARYGLFIQLFIDAGRHELENSASAARVSADSVGLFSDPSALLSAHAASSVGSYAGPSHGSTALGRNA